MRNKAIKFSAVIAASSLLLAGTAHAFNMGNMMNPSKWMGGSNNGDRYDDYYGGPGGYGGGPAYYGGGPGYGYGGAPGYGYGGAPGYGYGGAPGYGYGGGYGADPGYGGASGYSAPASGSSSDAAEIERLKARIKRLEEGSH
jgi:hypothetical protein